MSENNTDNKQGGALLPCPFCGGMAILGMFNVWCSKCRAATDKDVDASADGIIRCWNKRILSSRDAEIKQVLEGLSRVLTFEHGPPQRCWCSNWVHTPACLAARTLWNKVQT